MSCALLGLCNLPATVRSTPPDASTVNSFKYLLCFISVYIYVCIHCTFDPMLILCIHLFQIFNTVMTKPSGFLLHLALWVCGQTARPSTGNWGGERAPGVRTLNIEAAGPSGNGPRTRSRPAAVVLAPPRPIAAQLLGAADAPVGRQLALP